MKTITALALAALLCGCVTNMTPEQLKARNDAAVEQLKQTGRELQQIAQPPPRPIVTDCTSMMPGSFTCSSF